MKSEANGWTFAQTPIWTICDPRIADGALRLFSYLAWRQGDDDCCWPSITTISRDLHINPKTARRHLRSLQALGYLTISKRPGRSSHYTIHPDPHQASHAYTPQPRSSTPSPSHDAPQGGTNLSRGGTVLSRDPSQNCPGRGDSSVRGPLPKLSGGADSFVPHDDKKEQDITGQKKKDVSPSLWNAIKETIRSTMAAETYDAHFATATPGPLHDATLTIHLPSAQSHAATGRLQPRLARAITAQHHLTPHFLPPPSP